MSHMEKYISTFNIVFKICTLLEQDFVKVHRLLDKISAAKHVPPINELSFIRITIQRFCFMLFFLTRENIGYSQWAVIYSSRHFIVLHLEFFVLEG